jgi:hypothetical protein
MVNKLEDVSATISLNNPHIAVITESWLTSCVNNELINIPGYSICGKDITNRVEGGLCTYIRTTLNFIELK